jgi:transcriptional regulator with XRE-family HTH domain
MSKAKEISLEELSLEELTELRERLAQEEIRKSQGELLSLREVSKLLERESLPQKSVYRLLFEGIHHKGLPAIRKGLKWFFLRSSLGSLETYIASCERAFRRREVQTAREQGSYLIERLLARFEMNQSELARELSLPRSTLASYASSVRATPPETLQAIKSLYKELETRQREALEIREELSLSTREIASKTGISPKRSEEIFLGKNAPTVAEMALIRALKPS